MKYTSIFVCPLLLGLVVFPETMKSIHAPMLVNIGLTAVYCIILAYFLNKLLNARTHNQALKYAPILEVIMKKYPARDDQSLMWIHFMWGNVYLTNKQLKEFESYQHGLRPQFDRNNFIKI